MISLFANAPNSRRSSVTVFLLCALFFFLAMALTLLSSGVYRSVAAASEENYTLRTALSYLTNQVRAGDAQGTLSLTSFGGGDALQRTEADSDGFSYVTRLYVYDGWLRELYTPADLELAPEDGTPVMELSGLEIQSESGVLTFTVTDSDGLTAQVSVAARCEEEGLS